MIICQACCSHQDNSCSELPSCVWCYFTPCEYLYPYFLPRPIQSIGHKVCVFDVCQPQPIIHKSIQCAILCIYARNIPFMGVYQAVLLRQSVFLNKWLHIYCRIQNTKYNDENTRIWLSIRKRLDRHPWRVRFIWQKKSVASANNHTQKTQNCSI